MISLSFYQPKKFDFQLEFPSEWNELSFTELKLIAQSFFIKTISKAELFIELLRIRLLQSHKSNQVNTIITFLNMEDVSLNYSHLIDFIAKGVELTYNPFSLPNVQGPKPDFEDILVGEFEESDQALHEYNSGRKEALEELFKCFFRTDNVLPEEDMLVAALLFVGCKNQLPKYFPLVFPPPDDEEEVKERDPLALTRIIHLMAGPKNGTREVIRRTPLREFLFECQLEAESKPNVVG